MRSALLLLLSARAVTSAHDPIAAATGLITRILGVEAVTLFQLETIPADPATGRDVFEISSSGSLVVLRGNTGVSLATALNNYLKYSLNVSVSWGRNGSGIRVPLPSSLPLPPTTERTVFQRQWTYSWNVCTPGYSFVWYDTTQWQFMIDCEEVAAVTNERSRPPHSPNAANPRAPPPPKPPLYSNRDGDAGCEPPSRVQRARARLL